MKRRVVNSMCLCGCVCGILCGCATGSRGGDGPAQAALAKEEQSDAALQQRARAYADYAAGLICQLNDQPNAALKFFAKSAQERPGYEPLVLEVARNYLARKQPDQALAILQAATGNPSASGEVYTLLALTEEQLGHRSKAIRANLTAIDKSPRNILAYQSLFQIYAKEQRWRDAWKLLERARRQTPSRAGFMIDLAGLYEMYQRHHPASQAKAAAAARKLLEQAEALHPQDPIIVEKLGDRYRDLGDYSKAEALYQQLVKRYPMFPSLRSRLVELYLRTDQPDQAAGQLKILAREQPTNPQPYFLLGSIAFEAKKYQQAEEHFQRALLLDPDLEAAYYSLAGLHLSQNQPDQALKILAKAKSKFPDSFLLEYYSGIAETEKKAYPQAVKHLEAARAIAEKSEPDRLDTTFYFQLGAACERADNLKDAETYLRQCLKLSPNDAEALNYLGYTWADRGMHLKEARRLIRKAVRLEPKNSAYWDSLAWVLYRLHQPRAALPAVLKAIALSDKPDPVVYDHLGDIQAAMKDFKKACQAWRKSYELGKDPEVKKKLEHCPPAQSGS